MESLVKKYFWVINLALLAIIAYLAARVVNNVVAERIARLETTKAAADSSKKRSSAEGSGERAHWSAITDRNLFNANPPVEDPGGEGEGESPPEKFDPTKIPLPGEECEKSDAKLALLATMVADPSQWSMAVVDDNEASESRLIKEGQKVSEHTVAAIQRDRLVLATAGKYGCIELGQKGKGRKKSYSPKTSGGSSKSKSNIKDGIKKVGANAYEIDREMLNEQLDDLSALSRQARVIPHYRGGKPQGFKIVGVRPGSLYSHIGLRSGDVIKGVNDEAITSPNKALELYEKLKNEDAVSVEIERRGRKITNEYSIK